MSFFAHSEAPQLLRRMALSFQLTGGVEAMVSKKPQPATAGAASEPPPMVQLCKGEATLLIENRLQSMLEAMAASDDPLLAVGPASSSLLAVAMELVVRLRQYSDYPAALCRMSKRWFPRREETGDGGAVSNVHAFLGTRPEKLDVGASLQLHELAWGRGSEMEAAKWLLSPPLQELFDRVAEILLANSLDSERRHAEIKQWERSKLTHIATASRNAISMRFLRWRTEQCTLIESYTKNLRKAVRSNLQALAWQEPDASAWRPAGVRSTSATGGPASSATGVSTLAKTCVLDRRSEFERRKATMIVEAQGAVFFSFNSRNPHAHHPALDPGHWIQGLGAKTLDPRPWIQGLGSRAPWAPGDLSNSGHPPPPDGTHRPTNNRK